MAEEKPRLQFNRHWYKGILVGDHEIDQIEVMDTRDEDIWVCSYPRSGTTLTQEMVYLIVTGEFEKAYNVDLDERFPIIEVKDERYPYYRGIKHVQDMASPRMIKCHLPNFLLPEQLRSGKGRIIYICRNPKDVLTSFFRLLAWMDETEGDGSFNSFTDAFVKGEVFNGSWTKHVLGFWKEHANKNVLFLQYEDVITDRPKTIRKIADFLQKDLTDKQVEKICNYCQFDNMKKNAKCNMSYYRSFKHVNDQADGGFMNKGKAGAWRDLLKPETVARIDDMIRELDGSGLVIPDN